MRHSAPILRRSVLITPLVAALAAAAAYAAPISLTTIGAAVGENFDGILSSPVPADNSVVTPTMPTGWAFSEVPANTQVRVHNGGGTSGDTYLFGATGSTERAFGGLQSGSVIPTIGVEFANNTGSTITSLDLSYIGEMWLAGAASRGAADRLDFQYSTNATSLTSGTWTDFDVLDFNSPVISTTLGAKNGNDPGFRSNLSNSITGLTVANGTTFWLRWSDFNIGGSDDGLAVDTFSLTPQSAPGGGGPQSLTWNGGVGGAWQDGAGGWLDEATPESWNSADPDSAVFAGAGPTTVAVSTGIIAGDVTFTAPGYTLNGNSVTINQAVVANESATINSDLNLTHATPAVTVASGKTLTLGGNVSAASATSPVGLSGTGKVVVSGTVTGLPSIGADGTGIDVNNATLEVNGSINAGVVIGNAETGRLAGTGTVNGLVNGFGASTVGGDLTIANLRQSGTVAPGDLDGVEAGEITVANAFQYFNSTAYQWDLTALSDNEADAGTGFDRITTGSFAPNFAAATGTVNVSFAAGVSPDDGDAFWNADRLWKILDITGEGDANTDDFDNLTFSTPSALNQNFSLSLGSALGLSGADADDIYLSFDSDFVPPPPPPITLAVSEFMANPAGLSDATGEWVELHNFGDDALDLSGWKVQDADGESITLGSFTLAADGLVILALDKTAFEGEWLGGVPNANVIDISGLNLANAEDELILVAPDGATIAWKLAYDGGMLAGESVYLLAGDFGATDYGTKGGPVIDTTGTDSATGTTGYETNRNFSRDNAGYVSAGGDFGSPLALGTATLVPEPASVGMLALGGLLVGVRRRAR